ncbi:MAG: nucleotidyltransferase family protein [bacterium]
MDAIVLAGGLGKRLRGVVTDQPKPMAMVNNQPFLNYVLNFLINNGVHRAILATGYLHHKIEEYYHRTYKDLEIVYSIEEEPLGTGGAIKQAFSQVRSEHLLIINGDTFFEVSVDDLKKSHLEKEAGMTIALKPMHNIARYGSVEFEGTRILRFEEKQKKDFGYINAGVYFANRDLFDAFDLPDKFSFEEDFLKKYPERLCMHAFVTDGYFIDIGIPEDFQKAQTEMMAYS